MLIAGHNGSKLLRFSALEQFKEIDHGVFSRHGGLSQGPLASLNIGVAVNDAPDIVHANRLTIAQTMNAHRLAFVSQVHGKDIAILDETRVQGQDIVWNTGIQADAVITSLPGVFVAVAVADCQPILMYDPGKKAVAAVHSGWRGSLQNIAGAAVEAMAEKFGSNPDHIVAGIGPSLGPCCAEFINYKEEIPPELWPYKNDKDHFDFWAITKDQLMEAGLREQNIQCAGVCTKCEPGDFYSYRKNRDTGRFAAVVGIKG